MVEIYLNTHGSQVSFLSIPNSDVQRLSIYPFKWLQYVMFSICGAHGDLSEIPDGPPIDYGSTSFANIIYYYNPLGNCIFVDYQGMDEEGTTSNQTYHRGNFRTEVVQRDERCMVTQDNAELSDAAHLIPYSKGDEYIKRVVTDRSPLYHSPPSISGINDVQNGMLLSKTIHAMLSHGYVAFLKTPNYGLEHGDIQRVNQDSAMSTHITLHNLKKPKLYQPDLFSNVDPSFAFYLGGNVDVNYKTPLNIRYSLPPAIILDYMYGVAAYRCWKSRQGGEIHSVMESYHQEHYSNIPVIHNDAPHQNQNMTKRNEMAEAMDELNLVLMLINGITPQEAINRREKQLEAEEQKAQEASRSKVMEWKKTMNM